MKIPQTARSKTLLIHDYPVLTSVVTFPLPVAPFPPTLAPKQGRNP
jgi:hypothetical protein